MDEKLKFMKVFRRHMKVERLSRSHEWPSNVNEAPVTQLNSHPFGLFLPHSLHHPPPPLIRSIYAYIHTYINTYMMYSFYIYLSFFANYFCANNPQNSHPSPDTAAGILRQWQVICTPYTTPNYSKYVHIII